MNHQGVRTKICNMPMHFSQYRCLSSPSFVPSECTTESIFGDVFSKWHAGVGILSWWCIFLKGRRCGGGCDVIVGFKDKRERENRGLGIG